MKIYITRQPYNLMCEVYIVSDDRDRGINQGDVICFYNFKEDGQCIATQKVYDHGFSLGDMKPSFIVPENILREMLSAFTDKAREENVEIKSDSFIKGKLDATESHLADMRKLVFKN